MVSTLRAAVWDGGGANNNWSTANNWNPNGTPEDDGTALLIFGGTTRLTPVVDTSWDALGIVFTNTAGAFTIGGSSELKLQTGGIINKDTDTQTINAPIKLDDTASFNAAVGNLVFGGSLNKNGKALTLTGPGNLTFSGVISGGGDFTKTGSGTATFSGTSANNLGGVVYVNEGTLVLSKSTGLEAINVATTIGDGVGGALADILRLGANGQIRDDKEVYINSSGWLDLNGYNNTVKVKTIDGGAITTGSGTLTLGDKITTVGNSQTATISGKVNLGSDREFNVADGSAVVDLQVSAVLSGAYKLDKKGLGNLVLSGANTFSDELKLSEGTLGIGHNNAVGSGAFTILRDTSLYAYGGARTITNAVTSAENTTIGGSQALTFTGNWGSTKDFILTVTNTATTTISGGISGDNKFTKQGTGTLVLSGTNDFKETYINAGVVRVTNGKSLEGNDKHTEVASGAALELQGGITVVGEQLKIAGSGVASGGALRSLSGNNTWTGNISLEPSSATIASDSDLLTLSGAIDNMGRTATFAGAGDITTSGNISGSGGLVKNGTGTLTIGGATSFTGNMAINGGTFMLGANHVINNSVDVTLNGANFKTGGFDDTMGTLTLTANSIIDFGSGASELKFANSSAISWTGGTMITVTNWSGSWVGGGNDQLVFGTTAGGLTAGQVAQIRFWDTDGGRYMKAGILASGEVVPVPEPTTVAGVLLLLALIGYKERKLLLRALQALRS